jgi:hypothetical protein
MKINNFIPIEDVLVRTEILETKFSCDLSRCKGACCTMESEFGAPLLSEEVATIKEILPIVLEYLPERHRKEILTKGFYELSDGNLMTQSVDNKDCVFVYYEGDVAKCAIEKAFYDDKIDFKKPISCHLFPIRVSRFGGDVLGYEVFSKCAPALEKGDKENITIAEFCRESLEREYGENWYQKLLELSGKYVKS